MAIIAAYSPGDRTRVGKLSSAPSSGSAKKTQNSGGGHVRNLPGNSHYGLINRFSSPAAMSGSVARETGLARIKRNLEMDAMRAEAADDADNILVSNAEDINMATSKDNGTPSYNEAHTKAKNKLKQLSRSMTRDSDIVKRMREIEEQNAEKFSIDALAENKGISEGMLLDWLDKEVNDEQACLQLPFALLLVIVFAALSVLTLGNKYVQDVHTSIDVFIRENANFGFDHGDMHGLKALRDVHTVADVYSWLRLGFVPLMLSDSFGYSEHLTDTVTAPQTLPPAQQFPGYQRTSPLPSDLLLWNHLVGAVRLTQTTNSEHGSSSCWDVPEEIRLVLNDKLTPCYGQGDFPTLQQHLAISKPVESPAKTVFLPTDFASPGSPYSSTAEVQTAIGDLEKNLWITENVKQVQISFLSLNREFGLWTMTTISFTFRRGGQVLKDIYQQSTWLNFPMGNAQPELLTSLNLLWLAMNCYIFLQEVTEIAKILKETRSLSRFSQKYFGLWNVVDWLTVFSACSLIGFYFYLNTFVMDLKTNFSSLTTGSNSLTNEKLYDLTLNIMTHQNELVFCSYLYVLISLVRLFKGFSAQPRLGVVTNTIINAAVDILHFLVVFSSVFFAYALAGVIVFGRHLQEFATLDVSLTTCWRLVFGDFDWERTSRIAPWEAAVFFYSFTLLVVLIMLNMLLAIILDTYMDVKGQSTKAETLYSQAIETGSRYIRLKKGSRVSLEYIRKHLLRRAKALLLAEQDGGSYPASIPVVPTTAGNSDADPVPEQDAKNAKPPLGLAANKYLTTSSGEESETTLDAANRGATAVDKLSKQVSISDETTATESNKVLYSEGEHSQVAPGGSNAAAVVWQKRAERAGSGFIRGGGNHNSHSLDFHYTEGSPGHVELDSYASPETQPGSRARKSKLEAIRSNILHQISGGPPASSSSSDGGGILSSPGRPPHIPSSSTLPTIDCCRQLLQSRTDEYLTAEDLQNIIPNLPKDQSERTIRNALLDLCDESELNVEPSPACGFEAIHETLEEGFMMIRRELGEMTGNKSLNRGVGGPGLLKKQSSAGPSPILAAPSPVALVTSAGTGREHQLGQPQPTTSTAPATVVSTPVQQEQNTTNLSTEERLSRIENQLSQLTQLLVAQQQTYDLKFDYSRRPSHMNGEGGVVDQDEVRIYEPGRLTPSSFFFCTNPPVTQQIGGGGGAATAVQQPRSRSGSTQL
ncbi:unnamed protein product [Amoebophrya sp. A120]|nr:unnamed protein product [Amoebophrya sp. A120]|eukprot:GSA120T00011901001.1